MTDKKKKEQSNSRTAMFLAGAVFMALVVFFVFTKPKMSSRDDAREKVRELQSALDRTQEQLGKYKPDSDVVRNIIDDVKKLDEALPFKNSPTPTEDYALDVMEPISRAANQVGLLFPDLKAASVTESETIPGLFYAELGLNVIAAPSKINEFLVALDALKCDAAGSPNPIGCHPTIKNLTISAVRGENEENDTSNLLSSTNANIDFRLQLWFTTDPSIAALIDPSFKLLIVESDK
jgi:hypothetical protein